MMVKRSKALNPNIALQQADMLALSDGGHGLARWKFRLTVRLLTFLPLESDRQRHYVEVAAELAPRRERAENGPHIANPV